MHKTQVSVCCSRVCCVADHCPVKRLAKNSVMSNADVYIAKYRIAIGSLRSDFLARATLATELVVFQMAEDLKELSSATEELCTPQCC